VLTPDPTAGTGAAKERRASAERARRLDTVERGAASAPGPAHKAGQQQALDYLLAP
jgi:hypothetical protein